MMHLYFHHFILTNYFENCITIYIWCIHCTNYLSIK